MELFYSINVSEFFALLCDCCIKTSKVQGLNINQWSSETTTVALEKHYYYYPSHELQILSPLWLFSKNTFKSASHYAKNIYLIYIHLVFKSEKKLLMLLTKTISLSFYRDSKARVYLLPFLQCSSQYKLQW